MVKLNQKIKYGGELLMQLVREFNYSEKNEVSCCKVTLPQSFVLLTFDDHQSITMSKISTKIGLATSTTTRIIDNLVRDELVERKTDPNDRRTVLIQPTKKGKQVIRSLQTCYDNFWHVIFSQIPEEKIDDILNSLKILINSIKKAKINSCG